MLRGRQGLSRVCASEGGVVAAEDGASGQSAGREGHEARRAEPDEGAAAQLRAPRGSRRAARLPEYNPAMSNVANIACGFKIGVACFALGACGGEGQRAGGAVSPSGEPE